MRKRASKAQKKTCLEIIDMWDELIPGEYAPEVLKYCRQKDIHPELGEKSLTQLIHNVRNKRAIDLKVAGAIAYVAALEAVGGEDDPAYINPDPKISKQ
jgi:hypothetical protein